MNMHQLAIIKNTLGSVIHAKMLKTLHHMVGAAFNAHSLTATQLGRSLSSSLSERSGIRKADRFLSNAKLHDDYPVIGRKLCSSLIDDTYTPWILPLRNPQIKVE